MTYDANVHKPSVQLVYELPALHFFAAVTAEQMFTRHLTDWIVVEYFVFRFISFPKGKSQVRPYNLKIGKRSQYVARN